MRSNKWLYLAATVVLSLSTNLALAQGNGHGRGHEKHAERDDDRRDDRDKDRHEDRAERHSYREHDRELHEWYRSHYNSLPPGLAKRDRLPPGLERQLVVRGTLPPGLQKKIQPCPVEVERYLPPAPVGYMHTVIGGNIVLVNRKTFFVLDVFHFEM
jgi:Ni/Co efflux regulator RcnB